MEYPSCVLCMYIYIGKICMEVLAIIFISYLTSYSFIDVHTPPREIISCDRLYTSPHHSCSEIVRQLNVDHEFD